MKYENFNITVNRLIFRGKYGYKNTLPENITELTTCVLKNLTGNIAVLCCSSEEVLNTLKTVCDISDFIIEDISPVYKTEELPYIVCEDASAWICECGKENKSNFCTRCGKKRPPLIKYCTECGEKLEPDAIFCGNCGKKI